MWESELSLDGAPERLSHASRIRSRAFSQPDACKKARDSHAAILGPVDDGRGRIRTADPLIFNQVLYQLSYPTVLRCGEPCVSAGMLSRGFGRVNGLMAASEKGQKCGSILLDASREGLSAFKLHFFANVGQEGDFKVTAVKIALKVQ